MSGPLIRPAARPDDEDAIWGVLEPMIRAGTTYPVPRDLDRAGAMAYWFKPEHEVHVVEIDGIVRGTYYLKANGLAAADHVANSGFVVHPNASGRGLAGAMCSHSFERAQARGFRAMQYNFVIATNERAIALWQRMGMAIVGRLPGAFRHPEQGFVDALVMFKTF